MDLDGDGVKDLASGSYTGGVSFYRGDGKGGFEAEKKLLTVAEGPELEGLAASPCFADWDGDGDLDMVVGFIQGPVKLFLNQGSLAFDEGRPLTAGQKEITANDGGPNLTDWDGDGILDLLLGDGEGAVRLYLGIEKGSLELAEKKPLLSAHVGLKNLPIAVPKPGAPGDVEVDRPGLRVKPFAADWNGDGKRDLLVGDYMAVRSPDPDLTEEQRRTRDQLRAELLNVNRKVDAVEEKIRQEEAKRLGLGGDKKLNVLDRSKLEQAVWENLNKNAEFAELIEQVQSLHSRLQPLEARAEPTGFVWVYLRR